MKVMTVLGTRPEIIRLSRIIPLLDSLCEHVLVHTGQNYNPKLSAVFFDELELRNPDIWWRVPTESFGVVAAEVLRCTEEAIASEKPDRLLILGDTNSGLAAIAAKRAGIPVYHLEAGNRCYNDVVPEEVNRRIIDHCSDVLMPYTERSRANLLREGIDGRRVFVVGNPMYEVLRHYADRISGSDVLGRWGVSDRQYFLATVHRAETVDVVERLKSVKELMEEANRLFKRPVVCSVHPHTHRRWVDAGLVVKPGLRLFEPVGFFDFVALEKNAFCVLTDSGTVQEECCIEHVPTVVLRDTTERPEIVECGAAVLHGVIADGIQQSIEAAVGSNQWTIPDEYVRSNVSHVVAKIVLGR